MARNIAVSMQVQKPSKEDLLEIQESNKKRKQDLFKQFQEKNKKLQVESSSNELNEIKEDKKFTNENSENINKKLKNHLKSITEKHNFIKKELKELKEKDKFLREKIFNIAETSKQLIEDNIQKDLIIQSFKNEIIQLKKDTEELEKYRNSEQINSLKAESDKLRNANSKLKADIDFKENMIIKLNTELLNLESLGKTSDGFSYKDKYEKLKKENKNLKIKYKKFANNEIVNEVNRKLYKITLINKNLRKTNEELLQYTKINKIMIFLEYYMSIKWQWNWIDLKRKYDKNIIVEDVQFTELNEIKEINDNIENFEITIDERKLETWDFEDFDEEIDDDESQEISYGYLCFQDEKYYFVSIEGDKYFIINQDKCTEKDLPCKAEIVSPEEALLIKLYNTNENAFNKISKAKSKDRKNKISVNLEKLSDYYKGSLEGFTVLIVGSRFRTKYTAILTRIGLNVIWHNPFEEHPTTLINKKTKADVILLCADHISHDILDWIDKEDVNVQIVYGDTIKKIMARIKFLLVVTNKI